MVRDAGDLERERLETVGKRAFLEFGTRLNGGPGQSTAPALEL